MEISLSSLIDQKEYTFSEDMEFNDLPASPTLKALKNIHVDGKYALYGDLLNVSLSIKGVAILICAYSLEEGEYKLNVKDQLNFTLNEDEKDDEELIYVDTNTISLDEYVYSAIISNLPIRFVKKGAKFPQSCKEYRVLTEDEYNEEKKYKHNSPFDILDDLDLKD